MPLAVRVLTPEGVVLESDSVEMVVAPGSQGELGIMADHAPLISGLGSGVLRVIAKGKTQPLAVSGGLIEVLPEQVSVFAETAEKNEDIDVERARAARDRAQERLGGGGHDIDITRAEAALQRALNRIDVAEDAHS